VIRRIRGPAIVFDPVRRGIGESLRSADDRRRKSPRRTGCGCARPLSGVMALLGGLGVLVGFQARFGPALLAVFLIPVRFSCTTFGLRSIQP